MGDAAYAYVGWSPMAPEFGWRGGLPVALGIAAQSPVTYAPAGELFSPQIGPHVAPPAAAPGIGVHTTPYVPATPTPGRVIAHPVPHGAAFAALGVDLSKLATAPSRGTIRAQLVAVPSSALRFGARPPVPHVVRVDRASPLFAMGAWRTRWPAAGTAAPAATTNAPGAPPWPAHVARPSARPVAAPVRGRR
jgi:hypothetical protein